MGQGLQRVLKIHGRMKVNDVYWIWDYKNNKAVLESELSKKELSENKKFHKNKGQIKPVDKDDKISYR